MNAPPTMISWIASKALPAIVGKPAPARALAFAAARGSLACRLLCLFLVLGGCQTVGRQRPGTERSDPITGGRSAWVPEGVYQGVVEMDGGEIPAALEILAVSGREVRGILQLPDGVVAEGLGSLVGDELHLEVAYGGSCPGRIVLLGRWVSQAGAITGVIQASDCTGKAEGVFRFHGVSGLLSQG